MMFKDQVVVITGGAPNGPGSTNLIKIEKI